MDFRKEIIIKMNYKVCTKCGNEFSATTEFFYKQKTGKFGLHATCKTCQNKRNKEYCKNNPEKAIASKRKHYINNKEKIIVAAKKWQENNPEKSIAIRKKCQEKNKEKYAAAAKKYYTNNKEKCAASSKKYYKNNKERILTRRAEYYINNKEKHAVNAKKWWEANPDKRSVYETKRRAEKLNQTPRLTQDEKRQIELIYKKSRELGSGWQVDHIRSLSKGGLHRPDNLQIVLKSYNLQKNDKIDFRLPTIEELYIG